MPSPKNVRANNCCNHYGKTPCRQFFFLCKKTISSLKRTRYISLKKIGNLLEARLKGPGKRGYIVADTLSLMMNECCVSMLRKLGNICCRHKMFLNKIRSIFCVRNKCCVRANGNNVSSFAGALITSDMFKIALSLPSHFLSTSASLVRITEDKNLKCPLHSIPQRDTFLSSFVIKLSQCVVTVVI